jgi:hypothetical protein
MARKLTSIAIAYCAAVSPIAILMAGQTLVENLRNPVVEPISPMDWEIRTTAIETLIGVYLVCFVTSLPFFAAFRWLAGRNRRLNYKAACIDGGFTALLALAALIYFTDLSIRSEAIPVTLFIAGTGCFSGLLYWWIEQRLAPSLISPEPILT